MDLMTLGARLIHLISVIYQANNDECLVNPSIHPLTHSSFHDGYLPAPTSETNQNLDGNLELFWQEKENEKQESEMKSLQIETEAERPKKEQAYEAALLTPEKEKAAELKKAQLVDVTVELNKQLLEQKSKNDEMQKKMDETGAEHSRQMEELREQMQAQIANKMTEANWIYFECALAFTILLLVLLACIFKIVLKNMLNKKQKEHETEVAALKNQSSRKHANIVERSIVFNQAFFGLYSSFKNITEEMTWLKLEREELRKRIVVMRAMVISVTRDYDKQTSVQFTILEEAAAQIEEKFQLYKSKMRIEAQKRETVLRKELMNGGGEAEEVLRETTLASHSLSAHQDPSSEFSVLIAQAGQKLAGLVETFKVEMQIHHPGLSSMLSAQQDTSNTSSLSSLSTTSSSSTPPPLTLTTINATAINEQTEDETDVADMRATSTPSSSLALSTTSSALVMIKPSLPDTSASNALLGQHNIARPSPLSRARSS